MSTLMIRIVTVAVLSLTFSGCQSSTETYGGRERATPTPPKEAVQREMGTTMGHSDKQMASVLKEFQELRAKPIETLSVEEARHQPTMAMALKQVLEEHDKNTGPQSVGQIESGLIRGPGGLIPVRVYTPLGNGPFPVIVYYHGGGWVLATIDTYDASARALANAANAIVIAVEYRKAPEHRFPAAHEDAYAAYEWALRHARDINGDPSKVAVAGESAGGNLAGAVPMMARERHVAMPVHQILIYPVTGYDFSTPSYQEHANAKPLNRAMMIWFFEKYLRSPEDGKDPRISLVTAPNLAGLPPATIVTAEIDPLRSDGKRYAERLREAGVPVKYRNFDGVTHEFFGLGAVVPDAREAVQFAADGIQQAFGQVTALSPAVVNLHDAEQTSSFIPLALPNH